MVTSIATHIACQKQTREAFEHYRDRFGVMWALSVPGDPVA